MYECSVVQLMRTQLGIFSRKRHSACRNYAIAHSVLRRKITRASHALTVTLFSSLLLATFPPPAAAAAKSNQEVHHGNILQLQQPPLLSSGPVNVAKGSRPKRKSNADGKSSTATRNSAKSLVATIRVSATRAVGFKNCCMQTGRYDGALRNDFF